MVKKTGTKTESKGWAGSQFVSNLYFEFPEVNILSCRLPSLRVSVREMAQIEISLKRDRLINEGDDLSKELQCEFFKQFIHGYIFELRIQAQYETQREQKYKIKNNINRRQLTRSAA